MCTASIKAEDTRGATAADELRLLTDQAGQPFFHRVGDDPDLVSCVTTGQRVVVSGLSAQLCQKLGITPTIEGVFAQDPRDMADAVWLGGQRFVALCELTMHGDEPTVQLVQTLNCAVLEPFQVACKKYFAMPSAAVALAWSYPFLQTTGDVLAQTETMQPRLAVDWLPAVLRSDGQVAYLLDQPTEPSLQDIDPRTPARPANPVQTRRPLVDA
jgi:hypothetical protein